MSASPSAQSARTLIIAEAGVNHDGDVEKALELVRVAAAARADVVKFQTFCADRLASHSAPKATYQIETTGADENQWAMLKRLELTPADHQRLLAECRRCDIEFLSTPFDEESAEMLVALGVRRLKIPSGEVTNIPFLCRLAGYGLPLILSTGMCDLAEVASAVAAIRANGNPPLTILHCVSAYPAVAADCNLRALATLSTAFNVPVGFSDHTLGLEVSFAAVALGASVIEKHFTLDRDGHGPDHRASLVPAELHALVNGIRAVESALGDGIKRPVAAELGNRLVARKSIVTARAVAAGEVVRREHLTTCRPGTGLPPSQIESLLGRRSLRDLAAGELVLADAVGVD